MRTSFLTEIAFPILVICSGVGASTEFSISESGVQCNGPFQVNALTLDCGGGYCTFGSDVNVEATGRYREMFCCPCHSINGA